MSAGLTRRAVLAGAATLAAAPARAARPRFEVVGAELRWAGAPVRLKGVAVGDPILVRKNRPTSDYAVIANIWNANTVRISFAPGYWRADPVRSFDALAREIAAARSNKLFVIVDWHAIGFPDRYAARPDPSWGMPQDVFASDLTLAISFWTEAARSFGNDSGVLFELWNEPVVDPNLWVNTGQHWRLLKATWSKLIDAVRRRGDSVVLASGGRWAHDLVGVRTDLIDDPRTIYAWHCYPAEARGDAGGWAAGLDGLSCAKPVVVTEWGFCSNCPSDLQGTAAGFGTPFTRDVLDAHALHSTAWSWSPTASPAMLEADWTMPTDFGRFVIDYLAERPDGHSACAAKPIDATPVPATASTQGSHVP